MDIEVRGAGSGWICQVSFEDRSRVFRYTVTLNPADLDRWGRGHDEAAVADLVRRSFEFLLRREPASSILGRFELSVIPSYFPEYDDELQP